jgi:predicted kinase
MARKGLPLYHDTHPGRDEGRCPRRADHHATARQRAGAGHHDRSARHGQDLLGPRAGPFTLLGSDLIRAVLFPRPAYIRREDGVVYRVADALIWQLLREGHWLIYDAVNLSERRRWGMRVLGLDAGAGVVTVRTTAPPVVIQERLARRAAFPVERGESEADWSVYTRLRDREAPIRHDHIEVDSTKDIAGAIGEVLRRLAERGEVQ